MSKKILWVVGSLEQIGGGERLLLEGVKYYDSIGVQTKIVTWRYNERELFGKGYQLKDVDVLENNKKVQRSNILKFGFDRFKSIIKLLRIARKFNPDLLLCQSEYDAIIVGIIALILNKKFTILIFGQTYQFPNDNIKYSRLFRKHLTEIVNSCQGYKDSIPLTSPKLSFSNALTNNVLAYLRYFFIRKAFETFTLSKQVQWEVEKIYKIMPEVLRAGFSRKEISVRNHREVSDVTASETIKFLMVNRLVKKKRVDLVINAFKQLNIDYRLTIIGGGEEFDLLNQIIINNNLQHKINLTGRISDEKLKTFLSNSNVFMSLDVGDFDITVVEAMSYGLEIIVSSDFVIDDEFKTYRAITSVNPSINDLKNQIIYTINNYGKVLPDIEKLDVLTWEYYFTRIIKNLN